jgi:hypothetical protein
MKLHSLTLIVLCTALVAGCNFSAGKKKDFNTGLSVSNSGLSFEESYLVGPDNTVKRDNEAQLNSKIAIVLEGVSGYVLKDSKVYPGLMLSVTDKDGIAVLDEADLFANSSGYSVEDASILRGTVTVGNPMRAGETYHMKMRVWDHNKPDNEIVADLDFVVL